jgi:phospholipid/cholesterol/gamma-HCH transport system ATP-binding protein
MHSAFKVGDRIVMLHEGKLIFDGSPEKIRASDNPIIRRFIVGEADEKELESLTLFDREETSGK